MKEFLCWSEVDLVPGTSSDPDVALPASLNNVDLSPTPEPSSYWPTAKHTGGVWLNLPPPLKPNTEARFWRWLHSSFSKSFKLTQIEFLQFWINWAFTYEMSISCVHMWQRQWCQIAFPSLLQSDKSRSPHFVWRKWVLLQYNVQRVIAAGLKRFIIS